MNAIVVSDGKKGHVNQSLAFAELLGAQSVQVLPIKHGDLTPDFIMRLCSIALSPRQYPPAWRWRALKHYFGEVKPAAAPGEALIISAGTLTSAPALALSAELGTRSLHILMPSFVPFRCHDAIVLPQHDLTRKPARNVVALPIALGPVGGKSLEDSLAEMKRRMGADTLPKQECIAVLIGGESAHYHMVESEVLGNLQKLAEFARANGVHIFLTTSRRTPASVESGIKSLVQAHAGAFAFCVWGRADAYNPIPAFLELARAVVVTEESVSMVSEAVLGGHRPLILPLERRGLI
jgi:mitochondrial fission protein ELM1